jgi:hypothetical protein
MDSQSRDGEVLFSSGINLFNAIVLAAREDSLRNVRRFNVVASLRRSRFIPIRQGVLSELKIAAAGQISVVRITAILSPNSRFIRGECVSSAKREQYVTYQQYCNGASDNVPAVPKRLGYVFSDVRMVMCFLD